MEEARQHPAVIQAPAGRERRPIRWLGERFAWIALILPALAAISSGAASGLELKPFKDRLFSYPATLSEDLGGRYRIVDYRETRDIGQRDEVPERRVHGRYVSLKVRKVQSDVAAATTSGEKLRYFAVGDRQRPAIITVYLHGKGGSRRQGVDDFTFGGNFNRIKNLMADNGGLYLSPDFTDFAETGKAEVAAIIRHHHALSPGAAVIVACGSMGALICYRLAADEALAGIVSGYVLLGAPPDDGIFASPAFRGRTPFFLGHGSADSVYPIAAVEAFMRRFEARSPGYPVRLVRFETGSHGTPIRMTDWRDTINWMLALR